MFELSNIKSSDRLGIAKALQFLADNPDPEVRERPEKQLKMAFKTGQALKIERNGEICGISLIYKFASPTFGPIYSEIGTQRVIIAGYDLQAFLAKFHAFQIFLEEIEASPDDIFAIVSPGTASEYNLKTKVLMEEWNPPETLRILRATAQAPFNPKKITLRGSLKVTRESFRTLKNHHISDRVFKTFKNEEQVTIQCPWFSADLLGVQP